MSEIRFDNLGPDDYDRAKSVLNKAKHPGFVGRELFYRCATTGVVCIAADGDVDLGVIMVAKEKVQALSVIVAAQGRGVGPALVNRFKPKWVNAIGERIGFFEKLGYKPVGAPKVGQNGKHSTQLMQRDESAEVAETSIRDASLVAENGRPLASAIALPDFGELVKSPAVERIDAEATMLNALLAQAVAGEKYEAVLKLTDRLEYLANQRLVAEG